MKFCYFFLTIGLLWSCSSSAEAELTDESEQQLANEEDSVLIEKPLFCNEQVTVGAERINEYLPLLDGKKVAIVGNQTSMVGNVHLVDTLQSLDVDLTKVFSPEHGFRGDADAGESVKDGIDTKTGLPLVSLYGSNKKPSADQLKDVDVILFDIQDVGARFYTYISTLNYVMEAAAENDKKLIVLDRPNPNGHYVDGPILEKAHSSFVGMNSVPVVHGMTIGEYAQMLNGEGWLKDGKTCSLEVVKVEGWDHNEFYQLPVAPSPNLPNMTAVYMYPSLCFFEGTEVSIGRGTDYPFQCVGHPKFEVDVLEDLHSFKPAPNYGAKHPKLEGETCYGYSFAKKEMKELQSINELDLSLLIEFYNKLDMGKSFFLSNNFINLLAGTADLKSQIIAGENFETIAEGWTEGIAEFKQIRKKYLLYKDFE